MLHPKNAKIALLSLLALLLVGGSAKAKMQGQPDQPQQPEAQAKAPAGDRDLDDEKLNLSADQKKQIQEIRENTKSQLQAVRNDSSLTPEQRHEKMRQIHGDANKQIDSVLTPEQRKIWHERRREHHKGRHGRRPQP